MSGIPSVGGAGTAAARRKAATGSRSMESLTTYLRYLYGWLVAAQSEAPPPSHIIEAARHEMASMHRAAALGDATAALGHMKALAGVLRVAWADAEPELHHAR